MTELEMKYFVLKPRSKFKDDILALASRQAMRVYADTIEKYNPKYAGGLRRWAEDEDVRAGGMTY